MRVKLLFAILVVVVFGMRAFAGTSDPLFINLTSDDGHRSIMALGFGKAQMERGHPLTVYLNDKGVLLASVKNTRQFSEQQNILSGIIAKGGKVIVCPFCSKTFGVSETDLVQGAQMGNPDLTGAALFQDNAKTLSW